MEWHFLFGWYGMWWVVWYGYSCFATMTDIKFEVKVNSHKEESETKRMAEKWSWGKLHLKLSLVVDLTWVSLSAWSFTLLWVGATVICILQLLPCQKTFVSSWVHELLVAKCWIIWYLKSSLAKTLCISVIKDKLEKCMLDNWTCILQWSSALLLKHIYYLASYFQFRKKTFHSAVCYLYSRWLNICGCYNFLF